MSDSSLLRKLLIKPGMRIAVFNAPPGYLENLAPLPEGVELAFGPAPHSDSRDEERLREAPPGSLSRIQEPVGGAADMLDFVQLFVRDSAEYGRLGPAALKAVKPDGLLWICYPKKSAGIGSDLDREAVWHMLEPSGLRPVAQIAIDEIWSALRFRPAEKVRPTAAK